MGVARIEFRVLTAEESAAHTEASRPYWEAQEEHQRLVAACVGHEWEMELFDPEDGDWFNVELHCVKCPASTDDLYPDGAYLLYAEFDNGVTVDAGKHDSPTPLVVPVDIEIEGGKTWTDYGWEYDVEIHVVQRGSARSLDGGQ